MKSHRLGVLCKRLGVSLKNAHRAVHDATATAHCLHQMLDEVAKKGADNLDKINEAALREIIGSRSYIDG